MPLKKGLLAINLYGTGGFSLAIKLETVLVCHLSSDSISVASHKKGAEKLRKKLILGTRGIKKKIQD